MLPLLPAFTGTPEVNRVYNVNCFTLMAALPNQSVDAYILDLPYGTTACSWDEIIPFAPMWAEVKRTLKPRGVFVTTASQPFTTRLIMSNFDMFKYEWIWSKSIAGDIFNAKNKPMKMHENVLVFSDGTTANGSPNKMDYYPQGITRITNGRIKTNRETVRAFFAPRPSHGATYMQEYENYPKSILYFDNETGDHPTQKPVALYEYLIRTYTQAGELVVDFCAGSGTTALAARNTGRRFICGDINCEYVDIARQRLNTEFGGRKQRASDAIDNLPLFQSISNSMMEIPS